MALITDHDVTPHIALELSGYVLYTQASTLGGSWC